MGLPPSNTWVEERDGSPPEMVFQKPAIPEIEMRNCRWSENARAISVPLDLAVQADLVQAGEDEFSGRREPQVGGDRELVLCEQGRVVHGRARVDQVAGVRRRGGGSTGVGAGRVGAGGARRRRSRVQGVRG